MDRIKFLTTLILVQMEKKIIAKSKNTMVSAANMLQWNIYKGLCDNYGTAVDLINTIPRGSYPQYYSDPFISYLVHDTMTSITIDSVLEVNKNRQSQ